MSPHHELVSNGNGTADLVREDGTTVAAGLEQPVRSTEDRVLDAILDEAGVTDTATRNAIKAVARGITVKDE